MDAFLIGLGFGRGIIYRLNREYVASSDVASSDLACSEHLVGIDHADSKAINQANNGKVEDLTKDLASSGLASSDLASSDLASSKASLKQQDDESAMSMIKSYCRQWKSAKQISLEIGRHPTYTREIIKKMVSDGMLIQEYPKQPTHPAERYRIK